MLVAKQIEEPLRTFLQRKLEEAKRFQEEKDRPLMLAFHQSLSPAITQLDPEGRAEDYRFESAGSLGHDWRLAKFPNDRLAETDDLRPFYIALGMIETILATGYRAYMPDHAQEPYGEDQTRNDSIVQRERREGESVATKKVTADLEHLLKTAAKHDQLDVNIFVRGEPIVSETAGTPDSEWAPAPGLDAAQVVERLKSATESAQARLLAFLGDQTYVAEFTDEEGVSVPAATTPERFWITNAVGTRVTAQTLHKILEREDVQFVDISRHVPIDELIDAKAPAKKKPAAGGKAKLKAKSKDDGLDGLAQLAWSVQHINAHLCWQLGLTGKGIIVAMVDTGVNYNHPDLRNRMWKGGARYPLHGYNFQNNTNNPSDSNGHGTATAGLVAGDGTCGTKTGVAPEATVLAIRVGGVERSFWRGLQFALEQKANVISMSMTWKYPSSPDYPGWRRVCVTILAAGVLHANSIGNQGADLITYPVPFNIATPGNCPPPWLHPGQQPKQALSSPISVGATDSADKLAASSGRGPAAWGGAAPYNDYPYTAGNAKQLGLIKPDVCAPGPGTTSCNHLFPSQPQAEPYQPFGGTSAAPPHVAGCLAILAHACIKRGTPIVPARMQEALERTAKKVQGQNATKENHFGAGRVDVYGAFVYGRNQKPPWW